jgi:hypothetical protein
VAGGLIIAALAIVASPASAESPVLVAEGLAGNGVWAPSGDVDAAALAATVARAREAGVDLAIVVARDPQPDVTAFALRVRQLGGGDPVLVFGPDGRFGVSGEDVERVALFRAIEAAEAFEAPEEVADAFTTGLLTEPEAGVPELVQRVITVVAVAMAGLGVAVVIELLLALDRRSRRRRPARPPVRTS